MLLQPSWKKAKLLGDKHYLTGKPCKFGHIAPRFTSSGQCTECERARVSAWQAENPDRSSRYSAEWRKKNPEKAKAVQDKYRAMNSDKCREKSAAYRASNPEKVKNALSEYRKANPDKMKEKKHQRRALKLNSGGRGVKLVDVERLRLHQKKCPDCGLKFTAKRPATLDHVVPLTRGGMHDPSNIELRCKSCNSRKNNKDPYDYALSLGRLV